MSRTERILCAGLVLIVLLVAIAVFISPPAAWDAMEYNMPRIVMWIENRSVSFYPTADYQQLTMSPWGEYAMMQVAVLFGSDRPVNLVQWFAFAGGIIGVSLIARELGAGRKGQILAAVLTGTIPHAVLASSSAKTDATVAVWIGASAFYLLRWKAEPQWTNALALAAAIGLAILTKGTAWLLLPAILLATFWILPGKDRKRLLLWIPAIVLVILVINGAQFYRNMQLSGSPLGFPSPDGDADRDGTRRFANSKFRPNDIAANVLRNLVLHVETPSVKVNGWIVRQSRRAMVGIGVDPDDAAMIAGGKSGCVIKFGMWRTSLHEVKASNSLHLMLFLLSLLVLVGLRRTNLRDTSIFALGILGAFVTFCAGLRWQPYNQRFHLPVFMLAVR